MSTNPEDFTAGDAQDLDQDDVASPTSLPILAQRRAPKARALGGSMAGRTTSHHTSTTTATIAPSEPSQPEAVPARPEVDIQVSELSEKRTEAIRQTLNRLAKVDWDDVARIRLQVSGEITRRFPNTPLSKSAHADAVSRMVYEALDDHEDNLLSSGHRLAPEDRAELHRAVMDSLFGAGRLQPLLDLPGLENLEIEGCDVVILQFADGRIESGPAVADTDEQLIEEIRYIARTATTGENVFSQNRPWVRMTLPDGSRFAAEAWVSHRPSISVRKHRFVDTDLEQMRELGSIDETLLLFLRAAIRAGKNIIISGDPAAGKTTHARALLNELNPNERLATIEAQYELLMHHMPHRHRRVWAVEAQSGGEPGPDGRPVGEVTLTRLIELSWQKNVTRVVVGEVVGEEVMAMMEAMQGGRGSLSTIHASSSQDTIERLVTLITRARANVDPMFGYRLVAQNIDLIVHINLTDESALEGGRRWRFVDDVRAVSVSRDTGAASDQIFAPDEHGRAVPTGQSPSWISELRRHGFDADMLTNRISSWGAPPDLLVRDDDRSRS